MSKALKCICNQNVDLEMLKLVVFSEQALAQFKIESNRRLGNYCIRYCMKGLEELKRKGRPGENPNARFTENEEQIIAIPGNQLGSDFSHLICRACIKEINLSQASELSISNDTPLILNCSICFADHKINKKVWKALCKEATGGCCFIF